MSATAPSRPMSGFKGAGTVSDRLRRCPGPTPTFGRGRCHLYLRVDAVLGGLRR